MRKSLKAGGEKNSLIRDFPPQIKKQRMVILTTIIQQCIAIPKSAVR